MSFTTFNAISSLNTKAKTVKKSFKISKVINDNATAYSGFIESNTIIYAGKNTDIIPSTSKSTDGGVIFSVVNANPPTHQRAIVANGTVIYLGGTNNQNLMISTNSGSSWTILMSQIMSTQKGALISKTTDQRFVCATDGGSVVIHTPYSNITTRTLSGSNIPTHSRNCCGVDNLSTVYIGSSVGKVHKLSITWSALHLTTFSCDAGTTINTSDTGYITGIACSSDGTIVYACTATGKIYKSTNSGVNYSVLTNSPTATTGNVWSSMACSSNGNVVVVARTIGLIYLSTDGGNTWISGNSVSGSWHWIDVSSDGTKVAAGGSGTTGSFWVGDTGV
jgi:hypothetical protein